MSHEIETMAYAGATPWHGLGEYVTDDLSIEQWLRKAEIDWNVEKVPMFTQLPTGEFIPAKGSFALRRDSDNSVLDVVGHQYNPIQNSEAVEFFREFADAAEIRIETLGSLQGGRRVWALARLQEDFRVGGDILHSYVLLSNPHIHGETFRIFSTPVRVVCMNTLRQAIKAQGGYYLNHKREFNVHERNEARRVTGLALAHQRSIAARMTRLAEVQYTERDLLKFVAAISDTKVKEAPPVDSLIDITQASPEVIDAVLKSVEIASFSEADLNRPGKAILEAVFNSPGANQPEARGTWYGALNGVTYYFDHEAGRGADSRLTSAWFGAGAVKKDKALVLAEQFAGVTK